MPLDVEVIENLPEVIEISDDEDEHIILLNSDDTADLISDDNITVKEESFEEPLASSSACCHVEAYRLLAQKAQKTDKQVNPTIINKNNPAIGKAKQRIRKNRCRRKRNVTSNGLKIANNANDFHNKVANSQCSSDLNVTEPRSHIIKQETNIGLGASMAETVNINNNKNAFQNNCLPSTNSNTIKTTTASCLENPPNQRYNQIYSKLSWLKPLNNLSSPPHLQLVIVDRSHPDYKIDNDKWLMIEKRLLETLHTKMLRSNDMSIGLFDGAKWQRGIKIVGCHNEKALNFIKNFILNLDKLWAGAKLDVFTLANYSRQICKVFIPPPILKTDVVLSLIKLQNPLICSEDWKLLGERERRNGTDLWLSVNEESMAHLNRLRGEIKYGINRVFVRPAL